MVCRSVVLNVKKMCILAGVLLLGCIEENPIIPGTTIPQITSLPDNQIFVRGQNTWIANKGFSELSLEKSWEKWIGYKKTEGNTYVYYTSYASWTGYGASLQILVIHDSIARVVKTEKHMDGNTGQIDTISCRELPSDQLINYMSVDDMYKYAQDSVMNRNSNNNKILLQLFENGIMKFCKYYPNGCVDDCWHGVSIDSLFFGEIQIK